MANRLEAAWDEHLAKVLAGSLSLGAQDEEECKRAFFAGARALLNGLMIDTTPDEETDAVDLVQEYLEELREFETAEEAGD
jgi:hypothetical protein